MYSELIPTHFESWESIIEPPGRAVDRNSQPPIRSQSHLESILIELLRGVIYSRQWDTIYYRSYRSISGLRYEWGSRMSDWGD
jgi:hypothetical protein